MLAAREAVAESEAWAAAAAEVLRPRGVVLKVLKKPASASTSRLFRGEPPPSPLPIREADAVLLCDLDQGSSTGLFLDQHDTRLAVRPFAAGALVLNLFAYTGAFSVHAAKGGARRVTSVDVSKKALARGRENMIASGLDPDLHRWFPDDVRTHLTRAARRGDRYGLIILDPPVYGRGRKNKVHSLESQLEELIGAAVALIDSGGVLVLSVHALEIDAARLRRAVDQNARGPVRLIEEHGLPAWDHPVSAGREAPPGLDRGAYLKTLVLEIG